MATTLTRNLKLRINDNLTADAKYNLSRLDLLGSTYLVDSTNSLNIRSQTDIVIEPESADVDGAGVGGNVSVGTASHILDSIGLWGQSVTVPVSMGLLDQSSTGNKYLRLKYRSALNGSVDTAADRTLSVDMEGADRSLILGGSLGVLGGDLTLNLTGLTSVVLPTTGTLSTLAGVEELTNKTMDGLENTFQNIQYASLNLTGSIVNADVHPTAAIAYSKLALGGSIQNSDVSGSAAIAYSKLALLNQIVNADISSSAAIHYSKLDLNNKVQASDIVTSAGIPYSKLALTGTIQNSDLSPLFELDYSQIDLTDSITNSDINSAAAIAYSKLNLLGSILGTDISASAAIPYSKLNLTSGVVNSDVSSTAAIQYSKLNLANSIDNDDVSSTAAIEYSKLNLSSSIQASDLDGQLPYSSVDLNGQVTESDLVSTILNDLLPDQSGNAGKVLSTDGTDTEWITVSGTGTVTSVDLTAPTDVFTVSGNPVTTTGTLDLAFQDQVAATVFAGPATGADDVPTFRALQTTDIPTLPYSKLSIADGDLTIAKTNGLQSALDGKVDENAPITAGTFTKVTVDTKGLVTLGESISAGDLPSEVLTDTSTHTLSNKTIDGDTNTVQDLALSTLKTVIANANQVLVRNASGVVVDSFITNDNIDNGASISFSKMIPLTADRVAIVDAGGEITNSTVTTTTLGYLDATSSIQTQLDGKVDENAPITGATATKVTYDSKGLVTAGTSLDASDLPSGIDATKLADGSVSNTELQYISTLTSNVQDQLDAITGAVTSYKTNWLTADGTSKTVTHSLGTLDVQVTIFDTDTGETLYPDTEVRTDTNTVTLTATSAPATSWRVLVRAV